MRDVVLLAASKFAACACDVCLLAWLSLKSIFPPVSFLLILQFLYFYIARKMNLLYLFFIFSLFFSKYCVSIRKGDKSVVDYQQYYYLSIRAKMTESLSISDCDIGGAALGFKVIYIIPNYNSIIILSNIFSTVLH